MFLNAFAAVAESDLIATTPTRLAKRFAPAFGLRMHTPPLAIDPVVMELVRTRTSLGDPTIDWLANRKRLRLLSVSLETQVSLNPGRKAITSRLIMLFAASR
jgi:hypothetical protein